MRILSATALLLMAQYAFAAPLDTAHSQIGFTLTQMSSPMDGEFKHFSGNATLDLKHANTGRADITISTASIHLPTAQANSMAQSSDWFNVAKFPSAHFVASSIKPLGGNRYQFNGTLTIKGVTHSVSAPFTASQQGALTMVEGTLPVSRLSYKIGEGDWSDTDTVAETVQIKFRIAVPASSK